MTESEVKRIRRLSLIETLMLGMTVFLVIIGLLGIYLNDKHRTAQIQEMQNVVAEIQKGVDRLEQGDTLRDKAAIRRDLRDAKDRKLILCVLQLLAPENNFTNDKDCQRRFKAIGVTTTSGQPAPAPQNQSTRQNNPGGGDPPGLFRVCLGQTPASPPICT